MNITVTDQEKCRKQLRIEIPGDTVRTETDRVAADLARTVNIPGFRRGHVPKSVVKTRFRKELRDEVVAHLLPETFRTAVADKDLKIIGEPALENLKFGDDDSIDVTFALEVKPEIELSNYKSLPVTKRVYKIRDEDVEQTIKGLRDEHAELVPVEDRGAEVGDIITSTLTGRFEAVTNQAKAESDGTEEEQKTESQEAETREAETREEQKAEGEEEHKTEEQKAEENQQESEEVKQEDVEIEIGASGVLKEFTEALTGARPGDTRAFTVTYPAEYKPERFAGRTVAYSAEVVAVRVKELPEANDEFAQLIGENHQTDFKTMDELRAHIRSTLEREAVQRSDAESRSAIMETLIDRNRFEVPDFAVEKQMDTRVRTLVTQLANQGIDPRRMQIDWQGIREGQREQAEREVRGAFVLDRIAETENIEVTEEEINGELEQYAESSNQTLGALKARLTKEGALDSIKEQIRSRKALDIVVASAENTIEEVEGLQDSKAATGEIEPAGGEA